MIKIPPEKISQIESMYPGITEQIEYFEKMTLPACPDCGSEDTAIVNVGTIGRTICIAGATTKFHLRANGGLAYEGKFEVVRQGNLGFPKVIFPENFGSLD